MFEKTEHIKLAIGACYVTVTGLNLKMYVCKALKEISQQTMVTAT